MIFWLFELEIRSFLVGLKDIVFIYLECLFNFVYLIRWCMRFCEIKFGCEEWEKIMKFCRVRYDFVVVFIIFFSGSL